MHGRRRRGRGELKGSGPPRQWPEHLPGIWLICAASFAQCKGRNFSEPTVGACKPTQDGKPAPLTVKQAAAHWIFVDLDRSESWVHALEGCVPTLTRAHASRSIYCTHRSVSRFLFPIEHLLFMGAQRPQVKVALHNAPAQSLPR